MQVLLNHPEIPSDGIDVNHYAGASIAMEHLIRLGYRQIGHITFLLNITVVRERLRAYHDAIKRAGFTFLDEWLLQLPGYLEHQDSVRRQLLLRKFLKNPSRPKAVFAYSDRLARELIQVVWEQGLLVPQDLAVVGFDDMPPYSLIGIPLTTIHLDFRKLGYIAMERLGARLRGEIKGPPDQIQLMPQLIIRESSMGGLATSERWGRVNKYLSENFCNSLPAREVAHVAELEEHYFSKQFLKIFGTHFTEYIHQMRLKYAIELLETTEQNIEDIAFSCGFRSVNHFY